MKFYHNFKTYQTQVEISFNVRHFIGQMTCWPMKKKKYTTDWIEIEMLLSTCDENPTQPNPTLLLLLRCPLQVGCVNKTHVTDINQGVGGSWGKGWNHMQRKSSGTWSSKSHLCRRAVKWGCAFWSNYNPEDEAAPTVASAPSTVTELSLSTGWHRSLWSTLTSRVIQGWVSHHQQVEYNKNATLKTTSKALIEHD